MKKDYRAGLLPQFGDKEIAATAQVFYILAKQGGSSLVGKATSLSTGTFWQTSSLTNTVNAKANQ